jgi:hypothetical protein
MLLFLITIEAPLLELVGIYGTGFQHITNFSYCSHTVSHTILLLEFCCDILESMMVEALLHIYIYIYIFCPNTMSLFPLLPGYSCILNVGLFEAKNGY